MKNKAPLEWEGCGKEEPDIRITQGAFSTTVHYYTCSYHPLPES